MIYRKEVTIGARTLSIEVGRLARQAHGAALVQYGETVILATVVASDKPRENVDFFPLTVDVEERMYAAGKIPGGFIKREGRAADHAILAARLTDRPLRPLFPKGFHNDVQIVITVLSVDQQNQTDTLGIIGASAALTVSPIPFFSPVGAVRVGYIDNTYVVNPTQSQLESSQLDLVIAGTSDAVMMVEAGANELSEQIMLGAVRFGQEALQAAIQIQNDIAMEMQIVKKDFTPTTAYIDIQEKVHAAIGDQLTGVFQKGTKKEREDALLALRQGSLTSVLTEFPENEHEISMFFDKEVKTFVRNSILDVGQRPDHRKLDEIRPITCEVGVLPRTHGSGIFTRGETQALSVVTLGSPGDEQILDGIQTSENKRFIHHYNFPPFSTGETKPLRGPGRREIGHGMLVERAIATIIPSEEEFPYVIRIVSDILSSNGSSSMASVCGSTLALMDAGVPIHAPVAGIAMGLITGEGDRAGKWAVLSDIQGLEDALGDMDFKVAGTADGITALQMDIKVKGITYEIMEQALTQAQTGRIFIIEKLLDVLDSPREALSVYAPHIQTMQISPEKIGVVIGPGGKTIRKMQDEFHVKIDIAENGLISISAASDSAMQETIAALRGLTDDVEIGKIYTGTVKRIVDFGCFVEFLPGKEGLVRTSQLADYQVTQPESVIAPGDQITVMVIEVDPQGRVNLSRKAALKGVMPSLQELQQERFQAREAARSRHDRGDDRGFENHRGFAGNQPFRDEHRPVRFEERRDSDTRRRMDTNNILGGNQ